MLTTDEREERRRPHRVPSQRVGDAAHGPRIRADPGHAARKPATEDGSVTGSKQSGNKSVSPRSARLARDADGDPLGSAVFFDAADLRALGVHPDATDADRVVFAVENGHLVLDADGGNDGGGGDV